MDYISKMRDHIDVILTSSDKKIDKVNISYESTALNCEVLPRRLWVGKCMVLHKIDGVPMAKGIFGMSTPTSLLDPQVS